MTVVVCTDFSGKELHRQVGVDRVSTSGSLGGVMVSTLAWNARNVGLIPTLDMFPIFIAPMSLTWISTIAKVYSLEIILRYCHGCDENGKYCA